MLTRHGLSSVREPARPSTRRSNRPAISIAVARQEQMRSAIEAASPISQHRDADEHQGKSRRLGICCAWNPGRSLRSSANAKKREGLPAAKSLSLVTKSRWRPSARSGPKASPSSFSGRRLRLIQNLPVEPTRIPSGSRRRPLEGTLVSMAEEAPVKFCPDPFVSNVVLFSDGETVPAPAST